MASTKLTPEEIEKKNMDMWKRLQNCNTTSLMKKYVTKDVVEQYKTTITENGRILADLIVSGVDCPHSHMGIYLTDPGAYEVFKDLFDKVIAEYHRVPKVCHPDFNFKDPALPESGDKVVDFEDLDPEGKMIISTRARTGRNLLGHSFPPITNSKERLEIEQKAKEALLSLKGELAGAYHPMKGMSEEDQTKMRQDHFLFRNDNPCQKSAGYYLDWPEGRGIFLNENKTFLSWVNEGDHMRIISMQKGGNLAEVFNRLAKGVKELSEKLQFYHHKDLGFLTNCPSNLGTALRAGVHIRLPNLEKAGTLKEWCDKLKLQPRGVDGEHTESKEGIYDISNKRRLGLTEYEAMMEMKRGVEELMKQEKALAE